MVMLGAFIKRTNLVNIDHMVSVIKKANKANLFAVNNKALLTGYELFP
jgi:Pyruvate/2-oxoacid:ferredoxin oxidoreductase gamma subunit